MLHKRNNQLVQKNAAERVQTEILRCKLSEDGNNGHRVDFQAVTIKNLRSQIDNQKTQSEVDKTLMNLQRLLHTHERQGREKLSEVHGLLEQIDILSARVNASTAASSSSGALSSMPPPPVSVRMLKKTRVAV